MSNYIPAIWDYSNLRDFENCIYPDTPEVIGEYYDLGFIPSQNPDKFVSYERGASTIDSRYSAGYWSPFPLGVGASPAKYRVPSSQDLCSTCAARQAINFNEDESEDENGVTWPYYIGKGNFVGCPKVKFSKERVFSLNSFPSYYWWNGAKLESFFNDYNQDIKIKYSITGCAFMRLTIGYSLRPKSSSLSQAGYGWRYPTLTAIVNGGPCYGNLGCIYPNVGRLYDTLGSLSTIPVASAWIVPLFDSCAVKGIEETVVNIKGPLLNKTYTSNFVIGAPEWANEPAEVNYWAFMSPDPYGVDIFANPEDGSSYNYDGSFEVTFGNYSGIIMRGNAKGFMENKPYLDIANLNEEHTVITSICSGYNEQTPDLNICPVIKNKCRSPFPSGFADPCVTPTPVSQRITQNDITYVRSRNPGCCCDTTYYEAPFSKLPDDGAIFVNEAIYYKCSEEVVCVSNECCSWGTGNLNEYYRNNLTIKDFPKEVRYTVTYGPSYFYKDSKPTAYSTLLQRVEFKPNTSGKQIIYKAMDIVPPPPGPETPDIGNLGSYFITSNGTNWTAAFEGSSMDLDCLFNTFPDSKKPYPLTRTAKVYIEDTFPNIVDTRQAVGDNNINCYTDIPLQRKQCTSGPGRWAGKTFNKLIQVPCYDPDNPGPCYTVTRCFVEGPAGTRAPEDNVILYPPSHFNIIDGYFESNITGGYLPSDIYYRWTIPDLYDGICYKLKEQETPFGNYICSNVFGDPQVQYLWFLRIAQNSLPPPSEF